MISNLLMAVFLPGVFLFASIDPPAYGQTSAGSIRDASPAPKPADSKPPIPHYTCRRALGPIKIDGELGEKTWNAAMDVGAFYTFDGKPLLDQGQSYKEKNKPVICKMVWDDEAVYIGWECKDDNIVATRTEHDGHLWEEDVVEVFIDPIGSLERYYEIIVNPLNTIFDAYQVTNADKNAPDPSANDWGWTAEGMETAVRLRGTPKSAKDPAGNDSGWSVEMRLPFKMFEKLGLEKAPRGGEVWRLALTRYDGRDTRNPDYVHLAWSPPYVIGNPHNLKYMGYLHFADVPVSWKKPSGKPPGYY